MTELVNLSNKRLIYIVLCAIFSMVSAFAGTSEGRGTALMEKGYAGNVGVSVSGGLGVGADLFTSHGYCFGNGLWVGGGTGLSFPSPYDLFLPLYSEIKYSFLADRSVSPFLSARVGGMTNFEDSVMILAPEIGADIGRVSIFLSADSKAVGAIRYSIGVCWNYRSRGAQK